MDSRSDVGFICSPRDAEDLETVTGLASGLAEQKIPALDGLRAIAVFLVIFYHFGFPAIPGGLGVLIFFVISGFLITWLLLKEHEKRGAISLKRFYARRALRIFPAFYAYAVFSIGILLLFCKSIKWPQAVAALLYVANYYQAYYGDPGTAFSHTWSLGIEEQFYLIWPPLFILLSRKARLLITVPVMLIVSAWIYRAILQFGLHVWQGYFYEAFDARFDHLLVGCLLAIVLFTTQKSPSWWLLSELKWLPLLTVALLVGSVLLEIRYESGYRDSIGFIVNPLLAAILIPQLIALRGHWFAAWLQYPPVRYLGRISYSLYLYQQMVIDPVRHVLSRFPLAVQLLGVITVVIAAASASFLYIERPFLNWKDRAFHA